MTPFPLALEVGRACRVSRHIRCQDFPDPERTAPHTVSRTKNFVPAQEGHPLLFRLGSRFNPIQKNVASLSLSCRALL
ncbi:conserved hypothetical protein [Ricinus communis]|uniref:Uncharacterized protein n=1 Tax=Ricinus communis TaxID=3988 RepID=B9TB92_RICCO|nr:conserved hypothetical protein [Ricinus communis]